MFSCLSSIRNRTASILTAVIVASCAMQPVTTLAATPDPSEFCQIATDYNLNWHSMLQRGATIEQVVDMHAEVMKETKGYLPDDLVNLLNYMLYLTTINVDTPPDVFVEGMYDSCNKALNRIISSKKRATL